MITQSTDLALGDLGLDVRPGLLLRSITEQVHDVRALANRLVDLEEVDARLPSILHRLFPAGAVLSHTDDDVQAVVAEIETLAMALRAVADKGESVVLEVLLRYMSAPRPNGSVRQAVDSQGACHEASHRAL